MLSELLADLRQAVIEFGSVAAGLVLVVLIIVHVGCAAVRRKQSKPRAGAPRDPFAGRRRLLFSDIGKRSGAGAVAGNIAVLEGLNLTIAEDMPRLQVAGHDRLAEPKHRIRVLRIKGIAVVG